MSTKPISRHFRPVKTSWRAMMDGSGSHVGQGLHDVDEDIYSGRGKSAFLGGTSPADGDPVVQVHRPFDRWLIEQATIETLKFQVFFGVAASFEGGNDAFAFTFYDSAGRTLASLQFDTDAIDFGIWVEDGVEREYSGESFLTDYLHALRASVDLTANVWSAELDGLPIFSGRAFTAMDPRPTIAAVGAEWIIADLLSPGDNWLLFDD